MFKTLARHDSTLKCERVVAHACIYIIAQSFPFPLSKALHFSSAETKFAGVIAKALHARHGKITSKNTIIANNGECATMNIVNDKHCTLMLETIMWIFAQSFFF